MNKYDYEIRIDASNQISAYKLLILNENTWDIIAVCRLFVLGMIICLHIINILIILSNFSHMF